MTQPATPPTPTPAAWLADQLGVILPDGFEADAADEFAAMGGAS